MTAAVYKEPQKLNAEGISVPRQDSSHLAFVDELLRNVASKSLRRGLRRLHEILGDV